ncbi:MULTISPECIES: aminopeptidase N [unclassified Actinomyces]|uniref:aminopeptidase N n=1 Tax=unclassified Actinomyces TaxID=2609248 RepID=UPI0020174A58|nr:MULTISPECIES: aminopeptidase N [unclassified Actinomyces]MCL3778207.1 aminopeptidase N [Actinomyces sp. AC-20-1]MCL3788910.1 aminopeptidase N [Actinomyces sp. 187325]MCL3791546.1 aminopeptidase N [Actinomyces sp. 186855]MCL3794183.1 aminopeptidase N [Actinomyces sp. 217892]
MSLPTPASRPPQRPDSPTNLSREEAAWRSRVVSLASLAVVIDVTGAPDADRTGFGVRSEMVLGLREAAEGLWVDFLGEEVTGVEVDGEPVAPRWDGARIALPVLGPGEHRVVVEARGRYSNSGQGLHRFHDPVDGATYLYTHFEPSDARRAWPCADQPDLKAPFSLTVLHPEGWTVLANGAPVSTEAPAGRPGTGTTTMSTTRPLPSYLTAMAAGPWHRVHGQWSSRLRPDDAPVPLSWSCRASLAQHLDADELLAVTRAGMDLFDETYDYPYPWGTYDSVLVPEYNLGAMENPGCVTFNEETYLFQGPVTRAQHAGRANTILHEMCHMWFGDLVTPRWWEDTWLKESFADHQGTWAQALATEWTEAWATFALGRKAWAYAEDARPATTHPITATVDDVEAARQTFDGITYAKGAAVLKQLVAHAGQDAFVEAARTWFREHAFANGDLADFLGTLSRASGRDMQAWARVWLSTSGPSVLTPEVASDGGRLTRLTVRQEGTDLSTGRPVLRPHTLVVGLYSFDDDGDLVRTHRLPVTLEETEAPVPGAVGLAVPDLVTVNDEDLTYAVVRPDPASLATAQRALGRMRDPLARAVWWSSLTQLTRDALLAPQDLIATVLTQADDSTQPAVLARLLADARLAATRYTSPSERAAVLAPLVGTAPAGQTSAWELLDAADPGSDAQLVRVRAWAEAAGQGLLLTDGEADLLAERLRAVLAGGTAGVVVDCDLRWRLLTALARLGRARKDELDAALTEAPQASNVTRHLRALFSTPDARVKEDVLKRVLADESLSNDHLEALLDGYAVDAHRALTAPLTGRYLEALEGLWATRGQETATRVVTRLFPSCGAAEDLGEVDAWLAAHGQAPGALRRLVLKHRDDLARALRARR